MCVYIYIYIFAPLISQPKPTKLKVGWFHVNISGNSLAVGYVWPLHHFAGPVPARPWGVFWCNSNGEVRLSQVTRHFGNPTGNLQTKKNLVLSEKLPFPNPTSSPHNLPFPSSFVCLGENSRPFKNPLCF